MEADAVPRLRAALTSYLAELKSCMGKRTNVAHPHTSVAVGTDCRQRLDGRSADLGGGATARLAAGR